ncbi:MAG: flagellar basal body-associated FliL family protein [Oscillospiraceae bacterium]|jgi:flagellar basal body-associated protein FliL|nr:flagellar basal body-associated FliL family protein [Oscillospiraceae bacterium]
MGKKMASLIITAALMLPLLVSCGDTAEKYPGEKNVEFNFTEGFIINVSDDDRQYVKCAVMLEVNDAKLLPVLTERQNRLRDHVVDLISARTKDEVRQTSVKDAILTDLVTLVNEALNTESVMAAYFTEYTPIRQ